MTDDQDNLFKEIHIEMESAGFIFEGEQAPRNQKRKKELKYIHPTLNDALSQDGKRNLATKYYIKPLEDCQSQVHLIAAVRFAW